ncbi:MAG: hypothetical protein ACOC7J_00420 [Armatimonadota bacterium]
MERDNFSTFRRIGRGIAGWSARRRRGLVEWARRDWLRRLRRLGIGLLVLFVVLAIPWTYFNITLGMALEREIEQIRERGEPLTLEEALPETPPRSENAAYAYEEAFRVFHYWGPSLDGAASGTMLTALSRPGTREKLEDFVEGRADVLPDDARKRLFSDGVEQRLDAIRRASQMKRCVFPVNWEDGYGALLPHFGQFRAAQRLVTARMMIAGREGRSEEALEWCRVGLRMTEHISEEPTLIAFLVRVAMIEMLSRGAQDICDDVALTAAQAESIGSIAGSDDLWQHLHRAMEAERALGLSLFDGDHQVQDYVATESPADRYPWSLYYSPLGAPLRKNDQLTFVNLYELLIERMEHPWREVGQDWPDRQEYTALGGRTAPLTMVLMPVFSRAPMNRDAAIARRDQFQIALALNLYRQEHEEYPRTLEPLAGTVDWPIPEDIFSGEPFGYRREGDGYLLWSVGPDLDDDGGHGYQEEGYSWEDSDIVWRVEG